MKLRKGWLIKRGKRYYACWKISGHKYCKATKQTDRRDAEKQLAEFIKPYLIEDEVRTLETVKARIEGARGELTVMKDEKNPPLTLATAWGAYEKATNRPDSGPATLETYSLQWGCFIRWLTEKYENMKFMREVTKDVAGEYASHLNKRGVTPNTFNKHIRVCELVFRVLKDKARIAENPFAEITRKKQIPQSHRELTTDELLDVCQKADGEMRVMLALGLYLGARLGDAALMEWGNMDLKKGMVRYAPRKTARRSGRVLTVPLHPVLIGILSETPPPERRGYILPNMAKRYNEKGPSSVAAQVQSHFEKCGLQTKREGRGVRQVNSYGFHSLRHSAVSILRAAGAPLSVTMAIVGHSSLAMHDTYTHTGQAAMQSAVAALPSVLGDAKQVKELSAPKMIEAQKVRDLAEKLNEQNAMKIKAELMALCD